jgi:hypothetical protein
MWKLTLDVWDTYFGVMEAHPSVMEINLGSKGSL